MFPSWTCSCSTLLSLDYLATMHICPAVYALILSHSYHAVVYPIYLSLNITGGIYFKSIAFHQYNKATLMISLFFFACHATAAWSELKLLSDPEVPPKSDLRQFAKKVIYSCSD